jgi:hypothetical protein
MAQAALMPPVALLRPNCKRLVQPRQLRCSVLDQLKDMCLICGQQRTGISTAPNPRGTWSRSACPGFCPTAVWRRIAQDRRVADHRPLDSKIKANRVCCGGRRDSRCLHIGLAQGVTTFSAARAMCARTATTGVTNEFYRSTASRLRRPANHWGTQVVADVAHRGEVFLRIASERERQQHRTTLA